MCNATGPVEALLGLPGFRVLEVTETDEELVIEIETVPIDVGCPACGVIATAHDRMPVEYRDLAAFGRPVRLVWIKRRWRLRRTRVRIAHVDRSLRGLLGPVPAHPPRGARVLPAGRAKRPAGIAAGIGAWGVVGHGDGGGARVRRALGGRP